jgi:hypothetical protein
VNKLISTLENSFEIYICLQVGITISCHFMLLDGATLHYACSCRAPYLIFDNNFYRKKLVVVVVVVVVVLVVAAWV